MGVLSRLLKQAGTLAAPAKQTLASTKAILSKNAMIVGDDLAVKTERSIGIKSEREGAALWQSTLGALKNRAIIWPVGIGISLAFPALMTPALLAGASYLCYEVAHVLHGAVSKKGHGHEEGHGSHGEEAAETPESYEEFEKKKIDSFIRTDFIMAMETTAIGLGEVAHLPLMTRALSFGVAGMTLLAGVSLSVFGLLKIDDVGAYFAKKEGDGFLAKAQRGLGNGILNTAPHLMKGLSVLGVGMMLLVGGGMFVHNIPALHTLSHTIAHAAHGVPYIGGVLEMAAPTLFSLTSGLVAGFGILAAKPYVGAAYNKTLKPAVDFVSDKVGALKSMVFGRKKGKDLDATMEAKEVTQASAAEAGAETAVEVTKPAATKPAGGHAMDVEDTGITSPVASVSQEMARVATAESVTPKEKTNDNTAPADDASVTTEGHEAPKANIV